MSDQEQLNVARKQWEKGLTPLCVIRHTNDTTLAVLASRDGRYHCHRYFGIGDGCECSVDGQSVPLETVWKWLEKPTAATCRPEDV